MCSHCSADLFVVIILYCYLLGKLKAVTRKSSSGALHITFQSSSSSESTSESESESSSSSSDSSEPATIVSKNQRNNAVTSKLSIGKVTTVVKTPPPSLKATPAIGNRSSATGAKSENGQAGVSVSRRGRRNRKKSLPTNITVGGDRDVLTTKSTLYKSPVLNRKGPGTNSIAGNKESESSTSSAVPSNTKIDGKEAKNSKPASQWDVQPAAPAIGPSNPTEANSASISVQPPAAEQPPIDIVHPPRDYSTLPELQGPPRQGDKLAFKVRLSLHDCPFPLSVLATCTVGIGNVFELYTSSIRVQGGYVHIDTKS